MAEPVDEHSTISASKTTDTRGAGSALRVSIVFYHRDGTELFEMREPGSVVVGRSFPSDVVIPDPSLSRIHARFSWIDGVLTVTDLDSKNGTLVAGKPVQESRVDGGDEITLGHVVATVHVMTPSLATEQGIESYERARARLREELVRARTFDRPLGLLMVRALGVESTQLGLWAPELATAARQVDRIGVYDARTCFVLLPELKEADAVSAAQRLLGASRSGAQLVGGLAMFPDAASSDEELFTRCRQACLEAANAGEVQVARASRESDPGAVGTTVVRDAAMNALYRTIQQVSGRGIPVLIVGETGVGKEVLASALHAASRRTGPLRVINCATIPTQLTESILFGYERGAFTGAQKRSNGLFEDAQNGSVFLDEIGELSAGAQAALLRVLQEKRIMRVGSTQEIPIDVHVIAATHRNLEAMVASGQFRKDLLYRLNTITLEVPPLRARKTEVRPLAELFLANAVSAWGGSARRFSDDAMQRLEAHDWPGNVRELRNVIDRAAALCERSVIEPIDLPTALRQELRETPKPSSQITLVPDAVRDDDAPLDAEDSMFRDRVRNFELQLIREALDKSQGNLTRAAELLRMPIRTLTYKMKAYGLRESE